MHMYVREVTVARSTPNCVDCSRSVVHTECSVLHLLDDGWLIERGSKRGSEPGEVEAQQARRVREQ